MLSIFLSGNACFLPSAVSSICPSRGSDRYGSYSLGKARIATNLLVAFTERLLSNGRKNRRVTRLGMQHPSLIPTVEQAPVQNPRPLLFFVGY